MFRSFIFLRTHQLFTAGAPGVSATTTDDVVVFYIEADASTTSADLNGTGSNTQGDWVTGVDYYIVDDASLNGPYALSYFPTIYTICPNRKKHASNRILKIETTSKICAP